VAFLTGPSSQDSTSSRRRRRAAITAAESPVSGGVTRMTYPGGPPTEPELYGSPATSLPDALAIDAQRVEAEPVRFHGRVGPALAIDVIDLGPPEKDDGREFIALEERGPAALGIVAVCHSPPVVLGLRSNECGAASGVTLGHLEDHLEAGGTRSELDAIAVVEHSQSRAWRKDLFCAFSQLRLSLLFGLETAAHTETQEGNE
jgi:hypothetical protein